MIKYATNETTSKLIILYVMDKMDCEMTEDTILDMCYYRNKWVSYFTCKIALVELVKSGYVQDIKTNQSNKYYHITTEGRSCLSYFFNEIPSSVRDEIVEYIKQNKLTFRRKQEYFSDSYKNDDGSSTVVLKIVEPSCTKLEVKMNIAQRFTAKQIEKQWQDKASKIYAAIYDILIDQR